MKLGTDIRDRYIGSNSWSHWNPALERILSIAWLCKDLGWMTTNLFMCFPFGIVSVLIYALLVIIDNRRTFRLYNLSLLFWCTGNFLWMTVEVLCVHRSSEVHLGPTLHCSISRSTQDAIILTKTILFALGIAVQIFMYLGIAAGFFGMPEDDEDDFVLKKEAQALFRWKGRSSALAAESDHMILQSQQQQQRSHQADSDSRSDGDIQQLQRGMSLVLIENSYIAFWITKDFCWSWGTGDGGAATYSPNRDSTIFFESMAMWAGFMSIAVYFLTAYIYRLRLVRLLDCLSTICWICANYVWMCGEFFTRYDHLALDDAHPGNDSDTRVASSVVFCVGIFLQVAIVLYMSLRKFGCLEYRGRQRHTYIEMLNLHHFRNTSTSSSNNRSEVRHMALSKSSPQLDPDDNEESIILF